MWCIAFDFLRFILIDFRHGVTNGKGQRVTEKAMDDTSAASLPEWPMTRVGAA